MSSPQSSISSSPSATTTPTTSGSSTPSSRFLPRLFTTTSSPSESPVHDDTGSTSPVSRGLPSFVTLSQQLAEHLNSSAVEPLSLRALQGKDELENELHSKVPESPATSESPKLEARSILSVLGAARS